MVNIKCTGSSLLEACYKDIAVLRHFRVRREISCVCGITAASTDVLIVITEQVPANELILSCVLGFNGVVTLAYITVICSSVRIINTCRY